MTWTWEVRAFVNLQVSVSVTIKKKVAARTVKVYRKQIDIDVDGTNDLQMSQILAVDLQISTLTLVYLDVDLHILQPPCRS